MDNVFIERLWRSLKYECVYMNAFETGSETQAGLRRWRYPHFCVRGVVQSHPQLGAGV